MQIPTQRRYDVWLFSINTRRCGSTSIQRDLLMLYLRLRKQLTLPSSFAATAQIARRISWPQEASASSEGCFPFSKATVSLQNLHQVLRLSVMPTSQIMPSSVTKRPEKLICGSKRQPTYLRRSRLMMPRARRLRASALVSAGGRAPSRTTPSRKASASRSTRPHRPARSARCSSRVSPAACSS